MSRQCPHCGCEVKDGARFCPSCGQRISMAVRPEEETAPQPEPESSAHPLTDEPSAESPIAVPAETTATATAETTVTAPVETAIAATDTTTSSTPAAAPARAGLFGGSRLAIALIAAALVGAVGFAAVTLTNHQGTQQPSGAASAPQQDQEAEATADADDQPTSEDAASASVSDEARAQAARDFIKVYATNVIPPSDGNEGAASIPSGEWAQSCLPFVDPDSILGQTLANDPDAAYMGSGTLGAAVYVKDAEVVSVEGDSFVVLGHGLGTQNTWEYAMDLNMEYNVVVNADGQVVDVDALRFYQ